MYIIPLIFQFDRPHKPGTVCGFLCEQCGFDREMAITMCNERVQNTPMLILEPATQEEYYDNVKANGWTGPAKVVRSRNPVLLPCPSRLNAAPRLQEEA